MKLKDKILYFLLIGSVLVVSILFYFNNFYLEQIRNNDKVVIYVAKKDIMEGASFSSENVEAVKINKDSYLDSYAVKVADMNGSVASKNIYKNEPITKGSIEKASNTTKKFEMTINDSFTANLNKGDTVRIYVQIYNKKTKETFIFKVIDSKVVNDVVYKYDKDGNIIGVSGLIVYTSDEEALNYNNAKTIASETGSGSGIIVLKYNDMSEKDYLEVPQFEIDSPKLRKIIDDNSNYDNGEQNTNGTTNESTTNESTTDENETNEVVGIFHIVVEGDTIDSIAKKFNMTAEEIKTANPGVDFNNLIPGIKVTIKTF